MEGHLLSLQNASGERGLCCSLLQLQSVWSTQWKKLQDILGLEAVGDVLKLAAWTMHT